MRFTERTCDEFVEDHFPNMVEVRKWQDCIIWSAGIEEYLLVLFDRVNRRVTIFDYDTLEERRADIELLVRLRNGDDGDGPFVPAFLRPTPPTRTGENARPIPRDPDDID
jgi:hypothetical protein